MSWGIMAGLGSGLSKVGDVAQQYYENKRRRVMEDSQLETAALTRALAQAGEMRAAARNPLELESLQSGIDVNSARINSEITQQEDAKQKRAQDLITINQGGMVTPEVAEQLRQAGLSGRVGPDGKISISPITQSEMDARAAQARAEMINAGANSQRAKNDTALLPYQQKEMESHAKYWELGGGSGMRGLGATSPKAQLMVKFTDQYMKAHKSETGQSQIVGILSPDSPLAKKIRADQAATNSRLLNEASEWARQQVEAAYGPMSHDEIGEATTAISVGDMDQRALEAGLGGNPNATPGFTFGSPGASGGLIPPAGPSAPAIGGMPVFPVKR